MKSFVAAVLLSVILVPELSLAVELTAYNNCPFPVWLATTPNSGIPPLPDGTVQVNQGETYVYQIPEEGWAGRFWPMTGCDASALNCDIGQSVEPCPAEGCHPPVDTKIEFNFPPQPPVIGSWYDISLVDGYSLPMTIHPRGVSEGNCITTICGMALDDCPQDEIEGLGDLRVFGESGNVVACISPCKKWNYPPPYGMGNPELDAPGVNMCCPTPPITPEVCRTGPVIGSHYVQILRNGCPTAYSYAYDDEGGLHECPGDTSMDVTICP